MTQECAPCFDGMAHQDCINDLRTGPGMCEFCQHVIRRKQPRQSYGAQGDKVTYAHLKCIRQFSKDMTKIASEEQMEIAMEDVTDDESAENESQPQSLITKKRKQSELGDSLEPLMDEAEGMVCSEEWDQVNSLLGLGSTESARKRQATEQAVTAAAASSTAAVVLLAEAVPTAAPTAAPADALSAAVPSAVVAAVPTSAPILAAIVDTSSNAADSMVEERKQEEQEQRDVPSAAHVCKQLRTELLRATKEVDHIQAEWTHANDKLVEVQRRQRAVYKDFAERCRQTIRTQTQLSQLYKQHEHSLFQIESRMIQEHVQAKRIALRWAQFDAQGYQCSHVCC